MRNAFLASALLAAAASPAAADGLILKDGRKLIGRVVEKADGFEVSVEGQTLAFAKDDVRQWVKSPKDLLGDADRLFSEAKQTYLEAVEMKDARAADARFREALPEYERSLEAFPNRLNGHAGAGWAAELAGDAGAAGRHYRIVLDLAGAGDTRREVVERARAFFAAAERRAAGGF